ncbi:MAG TPA: hypothetical protein PLP05_09710, partial [Sedimentisphaerales bacterium]|nr:hypothetical protein [Sedimentisphaerales bacterium]
MNKTKGLIILFFSSILMICGCANEPEQKTVEKLCLTNIDKKTAMEKSEKALSAMNFVIEKLDVEQGYISTRPIAGGQWFEFWKSDNAGGYNTAESNIQSIRRTAELNFSEENNEVCVGSSVLTQRLYMPPRENVNETKVHSMFTRSGESMQTLTLNKD